MGFRFTMTAPDTTETGRKDNAMAKVEKLTSTVMFTSACITKDFSMEKETYVGLMGQNIMVISHLEPYKDRACIIGQMEGSLMDNGRIIRLMDLEHLSGPTVRNILVSSSTISAMVKALLSGQTVENTREIGLMGNNMETVFTLFKMENLEKVIGKMAKE